MDSTDGGGLFIHPAQTKSIVTRTERGSQGRNIRIETQDIPYRVVEERRSKDRRREAFEDELVNFFL